MSKNKRIRLALEQERREKIEKDKEIRSLVGRLTILEKRGKRMLEDTNDIEDQEEEDIPLREEAQLDPKDVRMANFSKAIRSGDAKGRSYLPLYVGKRDDEQLIDWFGAMENYFKCKEIEDGKKLKIKKSRLRGHALL